MKIRRALPRESEALSSLATSAKALWGYSPEQLAAWQENLRVSPESIESLPTFVALDNEHLLGVLQLNSRCPRWEVEHLWVKPEATRQGIGTALLGYANAYAREQGQTELLIDSDPNAEGFYLRCGARRVGAVAAPIDGQPSRVRPQLVLSTKNAA